MFRRFSTNARKELLSKYLTSFWKNAPAAILILCIALSATACGDGGLPAVHSPTAPAADPTSIRLARSTPTSRPSSTQGKATAASTTAAKPLGIDAARLKGVQIQFWYVRPERLRSSQLPDTARSLVDAFNRTNTWGIKVEAVAQEDYAAISDQIETNLYGSLPDVITAYSYQAARLDSASRVLVDLAPYVVEPKWGWTEQERLDFIPLFWGQDLSDGKRLGVPVFRSAQVLYYNQTLARELGYTTPPATPQEFKKQACGAIAGAAAGAGGTSPKGTPGAASQGAGWAISTDPLTMAGWVYAFGGGIAASAGGYELDTNETRAAAAFLRDLYDSGCAWDPDGFNSMQEITSKRALFFSGSLTSLAALQAAGQKSGQKDEWAILPFPSLQGSPVIVAYGPSLVMVHSTPEKQLAAWLFMKWMAAPENQAHWVQEQGLLPTRASVAALTGNYAASHPQWSVVSGLLSRAQVEPASASWGIVRIALQDAGAQLFSPEFSPKQIPDLVKMLDQTAKELDEQVR